MNDVSIAYVAAMIDAEGVVTIGRTASAGVSREWTFSARVLVTNSHAGLIGFLREVTGVGITYQGKRPHRENWSTIHRWQVARAQARELVAIVRPFLVVKAAVADVVLSMPVQVKGGRGAGQTAIYERQVECFERVKVLNQRGRKNDVAFDNFPRDHPAFGR